MKFLRTLLGLSLFLISCGNNPTFTILDKRHIHLVFKGTYESNAPYSNISITTDNSVDGTATSTDLNSWKNELKFIYDIAEIRVGNSEDDDKDKHPLVSDRFVIYTSLEGDFFNNGIVFSGQEKRFSLIVDDKEKEFETMYINNDIASGKYNEVDIYFRKYITYPAKIDGNAATTYFFGTISGYNLHNIYGGVDGLFPLRLYGDINIPDEGDVYIEIRIPFRNFLSLLEYDYVSDDDSADANEVLFVGFSDIKGTLEGNTEESSPLKGAIFGVVRSYEPDSVGTIKGNDNGGYDYIVAIPSSEDINQYLDTSSPRVPILAVKGGGSYEILNVPIGEYKVCGVKDNNGDKYPDSASNCKTVKISYGGEEVSGININ